MQRRFSLSKVYFVSLNSPIPRYLRADVKQLAGDSGSDTARVYSTYEGNNCVIIKLWKDVVRE
jgi:hypothetical protein